MAPLNKLKTRLKRYGLKRNLASLRWQTNLPWSTPLARRSEFLRRGFTRQSADTYDFKNYPMSEYLSDLASGSDRTRQINGAFAVSLLSDKLLCHTVVGNYIDMPQLLGFIERGRIYSLPESVMKDLRGLLANCEANGDAVLKPARGKKGLGVIRLSNVNQALKINGVPTSREDVEQLVAKLDDYLIEAYVGQAVYASNIFPSSANTLRIVTMRDVDRNHEPFIAAAIHKFGTNATLPTDNWTRGGLSAPVDVDTGTLGRAAQNARVASSKLRWSATHPDTGAPIEGTRVPGWPKIKAQVLDVIHQFDFLAYVGWDILVTQTGPCLIEGNTANVGVKSLQVHQPLLADVRVRRFFEFHSVIETSPLNTPSC